MKKSVGIMLGLSTAVVAASLTVAGTLALFSDSVKVNSHLKSGTFKVTLVRTAHSYSILDEDGLLKTTSVASENVDSADITNAFDLPNDALIVPQSELSATFEIQNNDKVAFDYSVSVVLLDEDGVEPTNFEETKKYLSQQLELSLTGLSGDHVLSDDNLTVVGAETVKVGDKVPFTVSVKFKDDSTINNFVMGKTVNFDLVVDVLQATN